MRLEVLISCMYQQDASIIRKTKVQSDVLIINQCDENKIESFDFRNDKGEICHARMIYTTERGLSRSRNMAIRNAVGDICLLCDDDEILENDYVEKIIRAFKVYSQFDFLAFMLNCPGKKFSLKKERINYFNMARIISCQIAFKRMSIDSLFCEKMGSGTGNGGGEENKFLLDNLKKKKKMMYLPILISSVSQTSSQWFLGYDRKYWINRGWVSKMIYGCFMGYLYVWYILLFRSYVIDKKNSWFKLICWMHKGFLEKRD